MKTRKPALIVLMLGILSVMTPFSIDMYLPAFPEIARDLNTTLARVSFSVSTYFVGFALGQLFYGPLLDRYGRKLPLYCGMTLYLLATIGCGVVASIEQLLVLRFLQALGGCVCSVAAMAMVRDFFDPRQGAQVISLLILVLGASPLLAPSVGGLIVTFWGWRFVFAMLAFIAALVVAMVFFLLPEGHAADPTVTLRAGPIAREFRKILRVPQFLIYAVSGSFSFAGLFVYVTGSPGIFMGTFQVAAKAYGGIFALLSIGFIGGSQLNHILGQRFESALIFRTTLIVQTLASILFFICAVSGWCDMPTTMVFLFVVMSCVGIGGPNASAAAMAPFSRNAGSASALLGFIQIGLGSLISACVGLVDQKGVLPTAAVMAASTVAGLAVLLVGGRRIVAEAASEPGAAGVHV